VKTHNEKAIEFTSLGQLRYLSAIPFMDAVVGNSSSGIIEVPGFNIPTINIGDRQKGRITGPTIFNCIPVKEVIKSVIKLIFQFDNKFPWDNPYGDGNTSSKILDILKKSDNINLKKKFHNLPMFKHEGFQ